MQPLTPTAKTPMLYRILTIDDNDAIHGDFRKILVNRATPSKLAGSKAALFGAPEAAPAGGASESARFQVDSALQGQEGLTKLQAAISEGNPYSVAFVDMRMSPGWDGLQTIQRLWEVDANLQVVICSAFSDYSWDEISEKLGLTDRLLILKKPFDPAEVLQVATALTEKWSLRRAAKLKMEELEAMVQERTKELTTLALQDKLTGLANRACFTHRLTQAIETAKTNPDYRFAVLFLDFDRFKIINDSMGHEAGDHVLKGIASRLTGAVELAGPIVGKALTARLGGDEFTVLIDGTSATLNPREFAERLLPILNSPYQLNGREITCTASIGVTLSELHYNAADDVLRDADTAMYHAKAAGKARFVFFDRKMHEAVKSRLELENDLRHALERNELILNYQPIVSLATGELRGFEALVRWIHPTRGLVSPADFIPLCEEIGLIIPFGLHILTRACKQLKSWNDRHPEFSHVTMSVNLSPNQFNAPDLLSQVQGIITSTGISPASLVLEITESAMMQNPDEAIDVMRRLRDLGVSLHLDDFGIGYSSLSSLHQFPLTGIKIDRSFMKNLRDRKDYTAIVHAIINLARHLNMKLIAEGIENFEQVALLKSMDCDLAQGFYFSRPLDPLAAETFAFSPPSQSKAA